MVSYETGDTNEKLFPIHTSCNIIIQYGGGLGVGYWIDSGPRRMRYYLLNFKKIRLINYHFHH
jgi:hypothetical protein